MIHNPILPGFNSDPCICRKGDDYYIAVSTFEWFPGIPVYHSRDLKNWELETHLLQDADALELRGVASSKGIWAPCLTWCEADGLFYLLYGIMRSMNARYFDIDNYLITAPDINGPWSEPLYIHSAGFDASLFHDDDGRKYISSLEWETRDGYRNPGGICLVEYSPETRSIIGYPKRISMGATLRGCLEGPHIYKHDGMYYLLCAEGGTGYYHSATISRAADIWGPYESYPGNPVITSVPDNNNETEDTDHLKPHYYNPEAPLQKAGHGSIVETPDGIPYMAFHCGRPFVPELCCTLGRETALQRLEWTDDGWIRMAGGGNLVRLETEEPGETGADTCSGADESAAGSEYHFRDDFDSNKLDIGYYSLRIDAGQFTDLTSRPGWVRLTGQQSLSSTDRVALIARKLTSVNATITTKMEFEPEVYQHSAGLVFFYDNMNYVWLRKYWSETLQAPALSIVEISQGGRDNHNENRVLAPEGAVWLRIVIHGRTFNTEWSADGREWTVIGRDFDTWHLSDEYSKHGEFTGSMIGIACKDSMLHSNTADFDFFEYTAEL